MCPNCGSCFSKKSNLYNHLHRGKGCPKRDDKEDSLLERREVRQPVVKKEKINFVEVKEEQLGDSDEDELSDLVIDDRNQSEIITEEEGEEEEEIDDEEREEQVEESYVEVDDSRKTVKLNRFEFLKANREMLQPGTVWQQSPPPPPPVTTSALNNLHLLADIAMAHEQYSDTSSEHDQEQEQEVRQVATIKPMVSESPINLSQYKDIKVASVPTSSSASSSSSSSSSPGYREIKPHLPTKMLAQPVSLLQPAGLTYQMIPVAGQTSQPVMMALQPIQTSGGVILANTISNTMLGS